MKPNLLQIAGAVIVILVSICIGAGGYYLIDVKERAERNTELNYVQDGEIHMTQQQVWETLQTLSRIDKSLDSTVKILISMDAKLRILVEGY